MAYHQAICLMMDQIKELEFMYLQRILMDRLTVFTREEQSGRNTRDQVSESTFGSFVKFH